MMTRHFKKFVEGEVLNDKCQHLKSFSMISLSF